MRKLLTIFFLFCFLKCFSQPVHINPVLGAPTTLALVKGWLETDSGFILLPRDTLLAPYKIGEQRFRIQDTSIYVAFSLSGQKWQRQRTANSGGGFEPIINPSNTIKQYWNGYKKFVGLNTDSIIEGSTNLFFTNARARSAISLTTIGTSGASTYNSSTGVLNIPNYTTDISGKLNISDTAAMLAPYLRINVAAATYVPLTRTLTINGTTQDLSVNRTWNVGTVTSVSTNNGSGITGGTITTTGTLAIDTTVISTKANVTDKLQAKQKTISNYDSSYKIASTGDTLFWRDYVNIKSAPYNCKDDNSTDNSSGLAAAIATGRPIFIPVGGIFKYSTGITLNSGQVIFGLGPHSQLKYTGTTRAITINDSSVVANFRLIGNGKSSGNTFETGIFGFNHINWVIKDMDIENFGGSPITNGGGGIYCSAINSANSPGASIINCRVYSCNGGVVLNNRSEYINVTGLTCVNNTVGLAIGTGNFEVVNYIGEENGTALKIFSGTNNGHGAFSNTLCNHSTLYSLDCEDIDQTLGVQFSNSYFYDGAMFFKNASAIKFDNITIGTTDSLHLDNSYFITMVNATIGRTSGNAVIPIKKFNGATDISFIGRMRYNSTDTLTWVKQIVADTAFNLIGPMYHTGITPASTSSLDSAWTKDHITGQWLLRAQSDIAGSTPTWQQTLIQGSQFSQDNTVDLNGHELDFSNSGRQYLYIVPNESTTLLKATPDGDTQSFLYLSAVIGSTVSFQILSSDNIHNQVRINGDAVASDIAYTADTHTFTGNVGIGVTPTHLLDVVGSNINSHFDDAAHTITFSADTVLLNSTLSGATTGMVWTLADPTSGSGYWAAGGGAGTVTSVGVTSTDLSVSGSPVTTSGNITLNINSNVALGGNPTTTTQSASDNSTRIATTAYVTIGISNAIAGVNPAVAVQAATIAILPNSPTYNNGASGIGAFITTLTLNATLVVDGYTPVLNDRILVKNEGGGGGLGSAKNGVYYVSQVAAVGAAWILIRALDYDQPSDINNTGAIPVENNGTNALTSWLLTSNVTTVGTSAITYTQFSYSPSSLLLDPGSNGILSRTSANTVTPRTLTGTTNDITITNGDGVSGNPTFDIGSNVLTLTGTQTLTNKRITARYGSTTSSATPTINTDNVDVYELTAQAVNITNMSTNLSGSPTTDQVLHIAITTTGTITISMGTSFEASSIALPTGITGAIRVDYWFMYTVAGKWRIIGSL